MATNLEKKNIIMKIIKLTVFGISIAFIVLTLLSYTLGQVLPFEFADIKIQQTFYEIILRGLPIAVLLTLFGTIRRKNTKTKNFTFLGLTVLTSALCFMGQIILVFAFGFGVWSTETILYKHKNENKIIAEQLYDIGAFGYGGRRIVEIKPVLKYWILPTPVDTTRINKGEWKLVNEQGNIKFP